MKINELLKPVPIFNFTTVYSSFEQRVYENSLCAVLACACEELFPERQLIIAHSISRGLYARISPYTGLPKNYISMLKNKMREIIDRDEQILLLEDNANRIREIFRKRKRQDIVRFLSHLDDKPVTIYKIRNTFFWSQTAVVDRTGKLRLFDLVPFHRGFILRFPVKGNINALPQFVRQEKLFRVFSEFERWGEILEVEDLGHINDHIKSGRISEFIKIAEALHEKKISDIADTISRKHRNARFIFIAGPSSSGKTTFMKRLYIQLRVIGKRPTTISLDDYFVDREVLRKRQKGKLNYEVLEALDLDLLQDHLKRFLEGKPVEIPSYNFKTGKKEWNNRIIKPDIRGMIIIEGIHGLNPQLLPDIEDELKFKIYISALTHLNIDNYNRISTRDCRLIRRIVRDHLFRGYTAAETLQKWDLVAEGEEKYIFPFQDNSDVMFNSFLVYELSVLKKYIVPFLIESINVHSIREEIDRLLQFFSYLREIDDHEVPPTSILREFIGGSSFKY